VFIRRNQLYTVLFIGLMVLQQSCGANAPLQKPHTDQVHEANDAEPAGDKETAMTPESIATEQQPTATEQEPRKVPELSSPTEILPESVLGVPEKGLAAPETKYDTVLRVRVSDAPLNSGWEYRTNPQGKVVGFEFSNRGGNRILPHRYDIEQALFFTRDFQFRFDDRARQDIHLFVSDWSASRDKQFRLSELMNSVMLFFPRKYLPAIARSNGRAIVTLPTGEKVEFDTQTYEILGGVFTEAPVDLNPDKAAREFAGIDYIGKGILIRANARGTDPRLGTTATVTTGSSDERCEGTGCKNRCQVPSKELWDQNQNGGVRFKFSTDEEFEQYLMSRCGFGLPKNIRDLTN
jgi:hypothetical protein